MAAASSPERRAAGPGGQGVSTKACMIQVPCAGRSARRVLDADAIGVKSEMLANRRHGVVRRLVGPDGVDRLLGVTGKTEVGRLALVRAVRLVLGLRQRG